MACIQAAPSLQKVKECLTRMLMFHGFHVYAVPHILCLVMTGTHESVMSDVGNWDGYSHVCLTTQRKMMIKKQTGERWKFVHFHDMKNMEGMSDLMLHPQQCMTGGNMSHVWVEVCACVLQLKVLLWPVSQW